MYDEDSQVDLWERVKGEPHSGLGVTSHLEWLEWLLMLCPL